jgi:hypothetical protein
VGAGVAVDMGSVVGTDVTVGSKVSASSSIIASKPGVAVGTEVGVGVAVVGSGVCVGVILVIEIGVFEIVFSNSSATLVDIIDSCILSSATLASTVASISAVASGITVGITSAEQAENTIIAIRVSSILFITLSSYLIQIFMWRAPIHVGGICKYICGCASAEFIFLGN